MKADIIYIQESQLSEDAELPASMLDGGNVFLAVIVQLKSHSGSYQPLISNLIDIRKEKLKNRIIEWFEKNKYPVSKLKIEVIEELSDFQKIDLGITGIRNLLVLAKAKEENRIQSTIKKQYPIAESNSGLTC